LSYLKTSFENKKASTKLAFLYVGGVDGTVTR